jgi:hypothetical protein
VLYYLLTRAAAAAGLLTLNISYDSVDGCASGAPITFEGRYTVNGEGKDGINIYVKNEDTGDMVGPNLTSGGGFYSIASTAPVVTVETTYHYRAYTEDQR